jgi:soluble cytochrome b562
LISVKADQLSEQHLAEIALAIQNRWNVATFVKMHEIVVMDDEAVEDDNSRSIITAPIDPREIQRGIKTIMENLELDQAFKLDQEGKGAFRLRLVDPSKIPKWVENVTSNPRQTPEGIYECPHCGKWCRSEFELSMHTKLHYIL